MKSRTLSLFAAGTLLLLAAAAPAASERSQQVLFRPKGGMFPAQGGPAVKAAFFGERGGMLVGGTGSLILGEGLGLGMGGYSLSSELTTEFKGAVHDVGLSYGGLIVENSFFPRKLFYFNLSTMIGAGQAYAVARQAGSKREHTAFFIVEPELSWMLNVTRELRIGLGLGYRVTAGADVGSVVGMDMHGFSSKFTLYYGRL